MRGYDSYAQKQTNTADTALADADAGGVRLVNGNQQMGRAQGQSSTPDADAGGDDA
jgi:hypothetical protein